MLDRCLCHGESDVRNTSTFAERIVKGIAASVVVAGLIIGGLIFGTGDTHSSRMGAYARSSHPSRIGTAKVRHLRRNTIPGLGST
jgi:hypothetical protein